jgi:hypothetical protein
MHSPDYIPSSELMEERLGSLAERIPNFRVVDQIDGLSAQGRWAAALGSINHPNPKRDQPPLMLFAIFVVIDLTNNCIRMANPLPPGGFKESTLFKYMAASMSEPMQGLPARPMDLVCPQPSVARILRPLMLRVGVKTEVHDIIGFEAVFDALSEDLLDLH